MAPLPGYERERTRTVEDIKADLRHMYLTIKVTEDTLVAQKRTARSLEREINRLTRSNSPISSASLSSRDTGRDTSSSSSSSYRRERHPRSHQPVDAIDHHHHGSELPSHPVEK